jgi:hypothetical protein
MMIFFFFLKVIRLRSFHIQSWMFPYIFFKQKLKAYRAMPCFCQILNYYVYSIADLSDKKCIMDCEVFTQDTLIKNGSSGTAETTFVEKGLGNLKDYAETFMKMLFMMRSHHMLTDVILVVEQELFHCHKVVLSAASPYFKAMFTGGLKESDMSKIKLQGVSLKLF